MKANGNHYLHVFVCVNAKEGETGSMSGVEMLKCHIALADTGPKNRGDGLCKLVGAQNRDMVG